MATNYADVYVKLPSGRVTKLDLLPSSQVKEIYRRVAEEEKVREAQVKIKYTGKVLKKTDTIGYLGICKETILKAEITAIKKINITIRKDDKIYPVCLDNVSSVTTLKECIEYKEGTAPSKQILKHDGVQLTECGISLADMKVTEGSVVELKIRSDIIPDATESSASTKINNDPEEECTEEQIEGLLSTFHTGGRNIEVVFSFDTTGSMYPCLSKVRTKLDESVRRLLRDIPNIRIGIMAMGDYCDYSKYVVKMKDLTTDIQQLVDFVSEVPATSGGDAPEAYEWVLHKAQQLDWSEDSAKALVVIGDEVPHQRSYTDQNTNWHDELDVLRGMGVKVYGVQALNNDSSTLFYEELADRTGGAHLRFQQFSLITDMFLAVCYKESSPEQLQAFCDEVGEEGRMTEEAKEMFEKLEEAQQSDSKEEEEEQRDQPKRYVGKPWWDPELDSSKKPMYCYDVATDMWSPQWKKDRSETSPGRAYPCPMGDLSIPVVSTGGGDDQPPSAVSTRKSESVWKRIKRRFSLRKRNH
ncbi:uncharacterized protein LOC135492811 [Lineus longissimus]|uniref:uncharacterized protein LOC135492811 n=1 Tax=Lineus longissimus TaxID=88925 RepID=UPI002B4E93BE